MSSLRMSPPHCLEHVLLFLSIRSTPHHRLLMHFTTGCECYTGTLKPQRETNTIDPILPIQPKKQVYNEKKPRLAVSGWFHGAVESEMGDWPGHTLPTAVNGEANGVHSEEAESSATAGAPSTLEQLKGKGATSESGDDGSPGAFCDDFIGAEVSEL